MNIRFAGKDDVQTISAMAKKIWPVAYGNILSKEQLDYMLELIYSPASLASQMQEKKHVFIFPEDDGKTVGFASYSATDLPGVFKLHKIYVLPDQQGKGLGKYMIEFVIENILPLGATALRLNMNRHNKAKFFYEKLGFAVIGQEDIDIGNNYFMNDYIMERKLS